VPEYMFLFKRHIRTVPHLNKPFPLYLAQLISFLSSLYVWFG